MFQSAFIAATVFLLPFGARDKLRAGENASDDAIPGASAWVVVSHGDSLTISNRTRKDSAIREFKAVGMFDLDAATVKRVIDDTDEYTHFMPYVTECRVLSRHPGGLVCYQRVSPPFVSARDYTIAVRFETWHSPAGTCYYNHWDLANEQGPAEQPGTARVKINQGSWLLEPAGDGHQTKATYRIYSDSGGTLPAMIVNAVTKTAIPKLFDSIRKQAKLPKYAGKN